MDLLGYLVFQILGQQISMKAAGAIFERLVDPCEDQMLAVARPWRPYGSLGANLLFAAMELDPQEDA